MSKTNKVALGLSFLFAALSLVFGFALADSDSDGSVVAGIVFGVAALAAFGFATRNTIFVHLISVVSNLLKTML